MRKSIYTPDYRALCRELRNIRQQTGLSQRGLAQQLKVPHSWIAKVETGERRIDVIEFCWFVSACGVDPMDGFARVVPRSKAGRNKAEGRSK